MLFYCPNCRKEVEIEKESAPIITKSGRVAHKANCPTCGQDMAEFIPGEMQSPPKIENTAEVGVPQPTPEAAVGVPQPSVETAATEAEN